MQLTIFTPLSQRIVDRLEAVDVNALTPLQALNLLEELQQELKEKVMTTNLRQAVGSLLVVGLSGTELTSLERAWLRLIRPAGIILFRRNINDADQTRALLDEATGLCTRHSVRYVDVEGGTVNRLRDALAPLPSAQAVCGGRPPDRQARSRPRIRRTHRPLRPRLRIQHHSRPGRRSRAARVR